MYDVRISDSIYEQARQAAEAQNVTLEALRLTPEQITKVCEAQADVKAGRVYSSDEAKANLETHRKEWLAARPS